MMIPVIDSRSEEPQIRFVCGLYLNLAYLFQTKPRRAVKSSLGNHVQFPPAIVIMDFSKRCRMDDDEVVCGADVELSISATVTSPTAQKRHLL
ncbi:hypothetical protein TNCT_188841 [Trichonephila clavata]|uniref:Uncharacterized protein n=1 Tax=Trichonephila clavata TaxID=2740835 RepID=A0A8X6L9Y1_TRICU|nr:hypothetical protein TNCT_188841 [Trichonephila clavata]